MARGQTEIEMRLSGRSARVARMVDHQFADAELAAVYDAWHPTERNADHAFYRPLALAASSVLDVGCGTGAFLHSVRDAGHRGRLCGLDPAPGMLARARRRADVEWCAGGAADLHRVPRWERGFDLVVMTGHAFQVLLDDAELRAALAAIRAALTDEGRFAFETRNPAARAWEAWVPENAVEVVLPDGAVVRAAHRVETPVVGEFVSFTTTYACDAWDAPQTSRSTLRFLDEATLDGWLAEAGLAVAERFGDFDRSPVTAGSPEIVTLARRA
jgi:SAM-dependent methyltransferase